MSKHGSVTFHVSAPLAVFAKLFVDDHSLEYVLNHAKTKPELTAASTIALFVNLFMDFRDAFTEKNHLRQFTCTALLNILWSISFQRRHQTELRKNENFLKTIKSLALDKTETVIHMYVLRTMDNMAEAASGIFENLDEVSDGEDVDITDTKLIANAKSEKPLIMISYAHADVQFRDKILAELEKNESLYDIWIDKNQLLSNASIWPQITQAIKRSKIVILFLSQEYFNSKSCRKEALFAVKREKSIIPVYIGDPGDCDWLGMLFQFFLLIMLKFKVYI